MGSGTSPITWPRALALWLLLFAIAFANGMLRELVIRRFLAELPAHQASCVIGISLILIAVVLVERSWRFTSAGQAWRVGFVWLWMTIAWEFLFGHFVMGHPWGQLLADYAFWNGRLWILVLGVILCAPAAARKMNPRHP